MLYRQKKEPLEKKRTFDYCVFPEKLIFIEHEMKMESLLREIEEYHTSEAASPLQFLFELMEYLLKDDMIALQKHEERLEKLEEALLSGKLEDFNQKILKIRKEISILSLYYEQLSDMGETLKQTAEEQGAEKEERLFGLFCERAGRFYSAVQALKEYSMQLREMHQTQIDLRQNEIMKVLTIVTTIFMPLTLIAGWYGMNFSHMPELASKYGYGIVCIVCLVIIFIEIWIFKKKKWF